MPRSCSRQAPAMITSASRGVHRVVALDRRRDAVLAQHPEQPQRHVEHDLQVHPRVVGHPEPLGGGLLGEPARLQLRVAVGGGQERGELAVALARRVDLDRGDRLARRLGRLAHQRASGERCDTASAPTWPSPASRPARSISVHSAAARAASVSDDRAGRRRRAAASPGRRRAAARRRRARRPRRAAARSRELVEHVGGARAEQAERGEARRDVGDRGARRPADGLERGRAHAARSRRRRRARARARARPRTTRRPAASSASPGSTLPPLSWPTSCSTALASPRSSSLPRSERSARPTAVSHSASSPAGEPKWAATHQPWRATIVAPAFWSCGSSGLWASAGVAAGMPGTVRLGSAECRGEPLALGAHLTHDATRARARTARR